MNDFTLEVHGGHSYDHTGAISAPIYLSATFCHPAFGQSTGYDYGRVANPTRAALEKAIALLERGERCWAISPKIRLRRLRNMASDDNVYNTRREKWRIPKKNQLRKTSGKSSDCIVI